ncbi:TIGR02301 family protein [Nitratireductor soli]|uniref:TIGR02301 family protein n=1 Tax=Nitratireductor soli TaxID=1670619 RepID=UPI00065E790F|nr:TIGR02301 family protein [Nitratireductor soli]
MNRGYAIAICLMALSLTATPAHAVDATYEKPLLRLAEVLGAVHYLRNICGEDSDAWRTRMQELLAAEAPSQARREKLVASFNHGYRAFAGTYESCTAQALAAVERYMKEGALLSRDIAQRYGN